MPNLDKDFDKYLIAKGYDPESAKKDRRYWTAIFDAENALQEAFKTEMNNAFSYIQDCLKQLPKSTEEIDEAVEDEE